MRPHLLTPLFAAASALPGIGPKTGKLLDRLLGPASGEPARVIDVLFHLPNAIVDRRNQPKIADAPVDQVVTLRAKVTDHRAPPPRSRAPYKVLVEDDTGDVLLVFFLANHGWIEKSLPLGAERWISGKLELWDGHRQMVHPDHVVDEAGFASMPLAEPVYGLTDGLYPRVLRKAVDAGLARLPPLPDWYDGAEPAPRGGGGFPLPTFGEALEAAASPGRPRGHSPRGAGPDAPRARRAFCAPDRPRPDAPAAARAVPAGRMPAAKKKPTRSRPPCPSR